MLVTSEKTNAKNGAQGTQMNTEAVIWTQNFPFQSLCPFLTPGYTLSFNIAWSPLGPFDPICILVNLLALHSPRGGQWLGKGMRETLPETTGKKTSLFTIAKTWRQHNRGMDKEDVVHISVEYYSATKNEIMPFAATCMQLEILILSYIYVCVCICIAYIHMTYIYIFFFRFFSLICCYKILSIVLCAVQ